MNTTYWDYIRTEDLLSLQGGRDRDEEGLSNHEVLFITVHQTFELWFKLVVRELVSLRGLFRADVVPEEDMARAARGLERITRILQVANTHWTVMETLTTRDYLDFRDKLFPASGFQSAQMREIELLFGLEDDERVGLGEGGRYVAALRDLDGAASAAFARVEARRQERPTLKESLDDWLFRTPIRGSQPADAGDETAADGFAREYLDRLCEGIRGAMEARLDGRMPEEERAATRARYEREMEAAAAWILPEDRRRRRIRAAILFIESYRELPLLTWPRQVLDRLVEAEQALLVFRQRHARMVERIIGRRVGTGGTSGVQYLDDTALAYRVFKDLWTVRTFLLRREDLPPLQDPGYYDFRAFRPTRRRAPEGQDRVP